MGVNTQDLKFNILAQVVGSQAITALKGQIDQIASSSKFLQTAVGALGAAFGAEKIVSFGLGILDTAENLDHLSQKTGASVSTLAGLQGAAELVGIPIENLSKGLVKLSLNIVQAANGNRELSGIFSGMGISLKDGNGQLKNSGDIIKELADKFPNLANGSDKAAIALKLFGKSGGDWIPVLNQGAEAFDNLGLHIDEDFAARATVFNESIKQIGVNVKNNAISSIKEFLPTLQELADAFKNLSSGKSDSLGFITAFGEAARLMSQAVVVGFFAVTDVIDRTITTLKEAKYELKGLAGAGTDADAAAYYKLKSDFAKRVASRDAAEKKFLQDTTANSYLFGNGTSADISNRQNSATDPSGRKRGTVSPDTSSIGENAKIIQQFEEKIAKLKAEAIATDESNAAKETTVLLAELESKGIDKSSAAYGKLAGEITSAVYAQNLAKEKLASDNFQQKQQEEVDLQLLTIQNYDKSSDELQKLTIAKQLDNSATEATKKYTEDGKRAYLDATESVKAQKFALIDLQQQQKETYSVGARQALKDYVDAARDVASQVKQLFSQAFSNMEDSLVSFVKTGKLNFQKFTDDILTDLIRIQVKAVLVQGITGLSSLFGSVGSSAATTTAGGAADAGASSVAFAANGGIMTSRGMAPLRKYASGGVARSPQLAVYGEGSSPEAFVPLPDGRSIPVSMKGGGGGNTTVSVTVNMESGATDSKSDSDKGNQLGKLIALAVKNEIVQQKRPGGVLS